MKESVQQVEFLNNLTASSTQELMVQSQYKQQIKILEKRMDIWKKGTQ